MSPEADRLKAILAKDPRYPAEAYHFVFEALTYTQRMLGIERAGTMAQRHVTGRQLLEGIRRLALELFGPLSVDVFHAWGIHSTDDFGEIVFNLVDSGLMAKTPEDSRDDFHDVYDFETALRRGYKIAVDTDAI